MNHLKFDVRGSPQSKLDASKLSICLQIDVWAHRQDSADVSVTKEEEELVKKLFKTEELVADVEK